MYLTNNKERSVSIRLIWLVTSLMATGLSSFGASAGDLFTPNPLARKCEVAFKDNSVAEVPCEGRLPVPTCSNPTAKVPVSIKMVDEFGWTHLQRFADVPPASTSGFGPVQLPPEFDGELPLPMGNSWAVLRLAPGNYRLTRPLGVYSYSSTTTPLTTYTDVYWSSERPWLDPLGGETYDFTLAADEHIVLIGRREISPTGSTNWLYEVKGTRDSRWTSFKVRNNALLTTPPPFTTINSGYSDPYFLDLAYRINSSPQECTGSCGGVSLGLGSYRAHTFTLSSRC
jgi:hypothetical protein